MTYELRKMRQISSFIGKLTRELWANFPLYGSCCSSILIDLLHLMKVYSIHSTLHIKTHFIFTRSVGTLKQTVKKSNIRIFPYYLKKNGKYLSTLKFSLLVRYKGTKFLSLWPNSRMFPALLYPKVKARKISAKFAHPDVCFWKNLQRLEAISIIIAKLNPFSYWKC